MLDPGAFIEDPVHYKWRVPGEVLRPAAVSEGNGRLRQSTGLYLC